MKTAFKNKNILITGGVGSVGKEIINQILKFDPKIVRILDIDESREFELEHDLEQTLSANDFDKLRFFLGDIRDKERLKRAIEDINIIFHTAALKHVQSCEYNPFEAVKTNILGLQNLINVSIENEVEKVIFTSTDKAANPTNTMGATKLLGERLMISANYYKGKRKTIFSSVRFGNVLGSRGSVIPLWINQIKNGGPVTMTDLTMTRFVMSMKRAVELLFKSTQIAKGSEVFIFKMPAIRLNDLVEVVIEETAPKYKFNPRDIKIKTIGLKSGEKYYEELMTEEEVTRSLETEDMFIVFPQLKELVNKEYFRELGATEVHSSDYNSHKMSLLNKEEIKKVLYESKALS
ncbi:MAG: hypothetical protein CVT88_00220 [Candidatus Altiarchaeales archaeon HGW-Altiarchaeales-1]|nr:MAG: hypothetical protein CVT88_00220 [Candidatus Altiarchaeales archaeon HGW-Altiarchaeales-1]